MKEFILNLLPTTPSEVVRACRRKFPDESDSYFREYIWKLIGDNKIYLNSTGILIKLSD